MLGMGRFAWLGVGGCLVVISGVATAEPAATATFPPAGSASAPAPRSAPTLLPPPPPPPTASPPVDSSGSSSVPVAAGPPPAPSAPLPAPGAAPPATYPPPYGYPPPGYAYYYPPQMVRARNPFPDNAAVASTPFIDVIAASVSWENRFSQFSNVGLQAGAYVAGRLRISANIILPTSALTDDYYTEYDTAGMGYYSYQYSKPASLLWGATVGVVAVSTQTFAMAPGVAFSRTDVSDYGTSLAAAIPLDWVMASGLRVGLELDVGRAFGGSYHLQCVPQTNQDCTGAPALTLDRPAGSSLLLQFQIGFGFDHPEPLPSPLVPQNAAPYGWPPPPATLPASPPPPSVAPAPSPG
jgi:hypothetical protein